VDLQQAIHSAVRAASLSASDAVVERLSQYYELLRTWNRRINLTALQLEDFPAATLERLIVEPLIAAQLVTDEEVDMLDLGSGGGSPAIPMKIACAQLRLTMVESREKKSSFLREAVRQLSLANSAVVTGRVETMSLVPGYRASIVTVRALRIDRPLLDRLAEYVEPSSRLFLFGGPDPLDSRLRRLETIRLPGTQQPLTVWRWITRPQ
jgi:16S rRNA (guanine527-N7)-methyltransferase